MDAPVWLSCAIYIAMGWLAAFFIVPLWRAMSAAEMAWLVAGGLLYTAGAVIFALDARASNSAGSARTSFSTSL